MKVRTLKYFAKEGFSNLLANKWMSIASACVVLTTLYIFGVFFLLAVNVDTISGRVEDQPLEAFLIDSADKKMADSVKSSVEKIAGVKKVVLVTKEEGLEQLKQQLGRTDLFNGIQPTFLPYKLVINVKSINDAVFVKTSVEGIKEIKSINYAKDVMDKLSKITRIIRLMSYLLIFVLGLVTLFIIIYTIKLTVFARRREINIMKYVGATDWFIKWPFVIEGVIIGVTGAFFAMLLLFITYGYLVNAFSGINVLSIQLIALDALMKKEIAGIFILLGGAIGAGGSIISVRKYLYV